METVAELAPANLNSSARSSELEKSWNTELSSSAALPATHTSHRGWYDSLRCSTNFVPNWSVRCSASLDCTPPMGVTVTLVHIPCNCLLNLYPHGTRCVVQTRCPKSSPACIAT